jgi:CheY-like chemotaxis protein
VDGAGANPVTVRVVLADDQPLVRAGLRVLIADCPDIHVVGEAGTGAQAVQLARQAQPDVVVMDIRMPGMDGIEATQMITAGAGPTRVVVLTTFDDDDYSTPRCGPARAASWSRTWRWRTSWPRSVSSRRATR